MFELQDLLFAIKSIKSPTNQFNINNYIKFSTISTRSGTSNKLKPPYHINNTSRHSYFHRIPYLWNSMPTFDPNKSFCTLKTKLKQYLSVGIDDIHIQMLNNKYAISYNIIVYKTHAVLLYSANIHSIG